jgi:hypothetical protein
VENGVGEGDTAITELDGDGVGETVNIGVGAKNAALNREFCIAPNGIYFI